MAPGGGGVEGDEVEFVREAGVKVELDGYVGLAEAQGVGGGVRAAGGPVSRPEPGQRRAPAAPATTYTATRPGQARGRDWPARRPVTR